MLTLENLSLGFRCYSGLFRQISVSRLSGLSLTLAEGELLAVIGSSGAGKSLLAHAILGLLPENALLGGEMAFRGQSLIGAYPAALRGRRIGLMPQEISHLDPLARARRQILWAGRRAHVRADVDGSLARLGLTPAMAEKYPSALSGGMARRVLLAMASVGVPDLLVADEPTAGLDPDNSASVLRWLRAHAAGQRAVLLIGHDLRAVLPYADRVLVLDEGRSQGVEAAADFCHDGGRLRSAHARALWRALPENGFLADA
jgi:peptide/nickel transport system ATP-binding protein